MCATCGTDPCSCKTWVAQIFNDDDVFPVLKMGAAVVALATAYSWLKRRVNR